jgi:hypothetical protein
MRSLPSNTQTAITQAVLRPIFAADFAFTGGHVRLHSGYGDLVISGDTYLGVGALGAISVVEEDNGTQSSGVTFTLTGIPTAYIATLITEQYQGNPVHAYIVFLGPDGSVVGDPFEFFSGHMDSPSITDTEGTATITIPAESELSDMKRSRERRYTVADQQISYPADKGFEFVDALQDKTIMWGRVYQPGEYTSSAPTGGSVTHQQGMFP